METRKKLFAFKLAEKQSADRNSGKWQTRDGIATAGCSVGPTPNGYVPISPFQDVPINC